MSPRSCKSCGTPLTSENTTERTGRRCLPCFREHRRVISKAHYAANRETSLARMKQRAERIPLALRMWERARTRAALKGVPFTITPGDISVPTHCPALGIPLAGSPGVQATRDNCPSLDRLVPHLGYIPGNVAVISFRANAIKSNAAAEEVRKVHDWMLSQGL